MVYSLIQSVVRWKLDEGRAPERRAGDAELFAPARPRAEHLLNLRALQNPDTRRTLVLRIYAICGHTRPIASNFLTRARRMKTWTTRLWVSHLFSAPLTLPTHTVSGRPITSPPNFELYRSWLRTCATCHLNCAGVVDTLLPKRIIDVGDGVTQHVRLVESLGMWGKYVSSQS